jgi:hypothetical protein
MITGTLQIRKTSPYWYVVANISNNKQKWLSTKVPIPFLPQELLFRNGKNLPAKP